MKSHFKTSHSKTKLARRCLKAYHYKYVMKLRKRVKSRPLIVGSLVHECLESYFRNGNYMPVIKEWREKEYNKMFKEEKALHADIIPLVKTLVRGYINRWDSYGLEMVWVEKEFEVEIQPHHSEDEQTGIILVGKIDGRARDRRNMEWLVEHKTCKKMPGEEMRIFDTQVLLYGGVLPHIGEKPVTGVIWDYVRTKLPAKPEVLAKGGLSTRKNIDTLPEVYLREIRKHGYNPKAYRDIIEHLEAKLDNFYRQVKLPLPKTMAQGILYDFLITNNRLIQLHQELDDGYDNFERNLSRDCSWCDYAPLCHAELRGDDVSYLIKHDYEKSKRHEKEIEIVNV